MAHTASITDRLPTGSVPTTWARPTALAYQDARDYLLFAVDDGPERTAAARRLVRTVTAYGRACGGAGLDGARAGTHLLAGHAAAECVAAYLRRAVPEDTELHALTDAVIAELWPDARPVPPNPASMREGAALRRHCRRLGYGTDLHPALHHLATAATSTELPVANRYAAALHRLTAGTHRHHAAHPDLADTALTALTKILTAARSDTETGADIGINAGAGTGTVTTPRPELTVVHGTGPERPLVRRTRSAG